MPHPPVLRAIRLAVDTLRKAGHTVVEWQPYKHGYAVVLMGSIFTADGGEDLRNALALSGEPPIPQIEPLLGPGATRLELNTVWDIQSKKYKYQQEYLAIWQEISHVDGWIHPVAPHAAIKHNNSKYYGYTAVVNLLDWPAVALPVTFADKETDGNDATYKGISPLDTEIHNDYDADIYHGAPVSVQVIGRRLQEEYVIGLAEQIGIALSL
ncbi:unnamed protein product [Didymodactylos carnosus]|uniref:Amidase domain-containing protein n=1 Tax=Didymodactylos carnosus TaxID=1234261 RepID=A0A816A149_9BILA|nr:unnamed protein product [Didymodactylos carnosus]CAF1591358.1 unnamed protein product [Didymodactylos carnosus]CAF4062309.1 unnamed protein product [Didymodactylos carnosus]CAF4463753.1 unnamed protein product [Didymodactylos carnosus]